MTSVLQGGVKLARQATHYGSLFFAALKASKPGHPSTWCWDIPNY